MMKYLQKLGKSLMLPVAALPVCALLMGLGYGLAPAAMGAAGATEGLKYTIGFLMIKAGSALIDHMALLFVVGVGIGMAEDRDGTAALAALVSWLMMTTLLSVGTVSAVRTLDETATLAFSKVENPFIAIIAGIIGAACYNRFKDMQLPNFLAFFSGKRFVAIATAFVSVLASVILLFVWPVVFGGLVALGNSIIGLGGIGAGIYAFLNRLLIPIGMHHALNNVFWFDTIGLGDLSHYWAGETSADVTWSLGMYMSGFFPCMMFGVPGAALAMVRAAKDKQAAIGLLASAALCAFICGVTEPFEFAFMFAALPLYVIYAALYGVFTVIVYYINFRAGFCFSGGACDLLFSSSLPAAQHTLLIIPLGIAAFVVFYLVFYFAITKFNLMTPGREEEEKDSRASAAAKLANNQYTAVAEGILSAVGGWDNVAVADHCATRLRLELRDTSRVNVAAAKKAGAVDVRMIGGKSCQVIIGTKVQFVYDEFVKLLHE